MAEFDDYLKMKMLEGDRMSPYEQFKTQHMQTKSHTSGIGVAGLVLGTVGTAAAVGAWIFGPMYGSSKANQAREAAIAAEKIANVQIAASQRQIDQLTTLLANERTERLQGQTTISQTITDTISGQQSSQLTATQQAELAASQATQQVMQQTYSDFVTGRASLNPTPVSIWQAAQSCPCPGCGCNG